MGTATSFPPDHAGRKRCQPNPRQTHGSYLGLAVLVLARAEKNREACDIGQAVVHAVEDSGWDPGVSDEAFDLHTRQGREAMPDKGVRLAHFLTEAARGVPSGGSMDWHLWILRWAVRRGALDAEGVEARAAEWDRQGRLRWGPDGYRPRRGE